jgi:predicted DNA-binding WGR domain protein
MHRHFEFVSDTSAKFWEVEIIGCDVLVRYGRLGSFGQSQTKSFPDPAAARQHAEKQIGQKTGKGYVETAVA